MREELEHGLGLLARLRDRVPDTGPDWLARLRQRAVLALEASGLPTPKHEAWRFTSLHGVVDRVFVAEPGAAREADAEHVAWLDEHLGDDQTFRVPVINGRPRLHAAGPVPEGVELAHLDLSVPDADRHVSLSGIGKTFFPERPASADDTGSSQTRPDGYRCYRHYLGTLARVEFFSALNLALFEQCLAIRIGRGAEVSRPIHVAYLSVPGNAPTAVYPRLLIVAEPGARATLIESFVGESLVGERFGGGRFGGREGQAHFTDAVTEIAVADDAAIEHVRVHRSAAQSHVIGHVAVRQEQRSRYASRVVTLGSELCRLELDVALCGEGAECVLDGAYHVTGREHVDHHTFIDHQAPRCTSRESYRGILDGKGHAVFDGTIAVRKNAQKTSAHQENRNLLLSDEALINTKPHLSIDADDVTCSHGATVGSLDEDQVFYLRARGLDERHARALLTDAFVRRILDDIPHAPLARQLTRAMRARLPHGETMAGQES